MTYQLECPMNDAEYGIANSSAVRTIGFPVKLPARPHERIRAEMLRGAVHTFLGSQDPHPRISQCRREALVRPSMHSGHALNVKSERRDPGAH